MSTSSRSNFALQVHELRQPENVYTLRVKWYFSIKNIKDMLKAQLNLPSRNLQLFYSTNPVALKNTVTLHDLGIHEEENGTIHRLGLSIAPSNLSQNTSSSLTRTFSNSNCSISAGGGRSFMLTYSNESTPVDEPSRRLVETVRLGLQRGQKAPKKTGKLLAFNIIYFN